MAELDNLTNKLKDSMAVLDAVEPSIIAENTDELVRKAEKPSFGKTTMKTDAQRTEMSQQMSAFKKDIPNPFASSVADEDLARVEEVQSSNTTPEQFAQRVNYDADPIKQESIASVTFGDGAADEDPDKFDEEEMKRIERILKKE